MAERLVREQQPWLGHKGAGERNALAHTAGQFMRISADKLGQPKAIEPGPRTVRLLARVAAEQLKRQPYIVERRTPWQQAILLKHGGEHTTK